MDNKALLNRIYKNVDFLILINGYERGEVEKAIGVSVGYISRSREHNVDLPITKIVALAQFFHTQVDYLIGHNFEADYLKGQIAKIQCRLDEIDTENRQYRESFKKGE